MNEKQHERILIGSTLLLGVCAGLDLLLWQRLSLPVVAALLPYLLVSLIVNVLVFARIRLKRLTDDEKRAEALERIEQPESSVFGSGEGPEPFTSARSQEQFEKYIVPAMSLVLALVQGVAAWMLYRTTATQVTNPTQPLLAAAFMAGQAFAFFLLSRYMLGLGRTETGRLMRGSGLYLGLLCYASLLAGIICVVSKDIAPGASHIAVWIFAIVLALLSIENVLGFIGHIYRPRHNGKRAAAYESRLSALLADPATWAKNVAQALDYQFGFNVSQTWFYRFLENDIVPLFIFQITVLYLLSCLVFLGPEEAGILEHFGRPVEPPAGLLQSGFHLKYPWPFATVQRFPVKRVQTQHIGFAPGVDAATPPAMLWTVAHHGSKEIFLTASREQKTEGNLGASVPVNFLSVHLPVEYRITNMYQYAYNYTEPDALLREVACRAVTREAVSRGLFDMVGKGQLHVTEALRTRIQSEVNKMQLGLKIEFVGMQGIHPPVAVADAFESVIGALEEKEAYILAAQAYTNNILPLAAAEATSEMRKAEAYRLRRTEMAEAEAYRFTQRLLGYEKSPQVFRSDIYLRTLQRALTSTRKYIISATPAHEVIQIDFENRLGADVFLDAAPKSWEGKGL